MNKSRIASLARTQWLIRRTLFQLSILGLLFFAYALGTLPTLPTNIVRAAGSPTATYIPQPAPAYVNYAEALQKSIYYYDASKSGPGITGGRLDWRGDSDPLDSAVPLAAATPQTNMSAAFIAANKSVLDPNNTGVLDLHGGFHDAGDHVKFGLPQGYAASTLGWAYWEFKNAFTSTGQDGHMLEELKWFTDYFLRSTFRDSTGKVIAFAYQVGDGGLDHPYWGPPELQTNPNGGWSTLRPAWLSTSEAPALDMTGEAAASLAIMSLNYQSIDPTYAAKALDTAKALYAFGRTYVPKFTPGGKLDDSTLVGYSGGFYGSSGWADEMSWAAVWLYTATGNAQYISDITSLDTNGNYTGYLARLMNNTTSTWQNIWVHSWDAVWGGVFLRLNQIYNFDPNFCTANAALCTTFMKNEMQYFARWNLEYWSGVQHADPNDTNFLAANPSGYKVINTWGSNRYNTAAEMEALVYLKDTGDKRFADWAQTQMNYIMGGNITHLKDGTTVSGKGYIIGYGPSYFDHPHHGAAHGSFTNSGKDPADPRHMLWGGLLGGPDTTDTFNDATDDFVYTETTVDYQSTLVGALAGFEMFYPTSKNTTVANFPPTETPYAADFAKAEIETENNQASQVTIQINNQSATPPQFQTGLSARYYFDISELVAAGQNISAVSIMLNYDEAATSEKSPTTVSGPFSAGGNLYYYQFSWTDPYLHGSRNLEFSLTAAGDAQSKTHWDATNDPSNAGLTLCAQQGSCLIQTTNVPVYRNGTLVFGQVPTAPTAVPTITPGGPTRTPSPVPAAALKAQIKTGGTDNSQQTSFTFHIVNTGATAGTNISTRIYFTADNGNAGTGYMLEKYYDQSATATTSGPTLVSGSIYYLTISFGTASLAPGSSWEYQTSLHLISWGSNYDGSNDWYHTGYAVGALPAALTDTNYLPVYVGGNKVWGLEPGGTAATPTFVPPTNTSVPPTKTNTPVGPTNTPVPPTLTRTPSNTPIPPTKTNTPTGATATPTRTITTTNTVVPPTKTNTPVGSTNTPIPPTKTSTPVGSTNTPVPPTKTNIPLPTATTAKTNTPVATMSGTCTPNATITAPFSFDGAGTLCWKTNSLGSYINSWNLASLTINGVNITNLYVASGSYPAKASDGFWYIAYNSTVAFGHFETK